MTLTLGQKRSADRGLNSNHLHLRRERIDCAGDPGDQPTPSERHDHHGEVVDDLDELEAERALPCHDRRIVERMDEVKTGLPGTFLGQHNAVVERVALEVHRGAVTHRRLRFGDRRLRWHVHLAPHARRACRESGRLGVVTGRGHDDAGRGPAAESCQLRRRAADLERTGRLEILRFQDDA